jgi:hypothetical protein
MRNAKDLQEEKRRNERSREKMNRRGGWSVLYCNFTDRT